VIDLEFTLGICAVFAAAAGAYWVRWTRVGAARFARVDRAGSSVLLGKGAMEMAYWSLQPVARACIFLGLTANGVTLVSLALGAAAGVALGLGHFGVAAALTAASSLGDALDGIVARQTGTASDAGEVFDAAVDRYEEFFFLGGLAYYFRASDLALGLVLLATLGSFMVSYGTAKAEALQVESPRGAMRRAERAVYLGAGVLFVPIAQALSVRFGLPAWVGTAPILAALALVGIVGNVSAVRRLLAIAHAVAVRAGQQRAPAPSDPEESEDAVRRVTADAATYASMPPVESARAGLRADAPAQ
jgi:CDP-diacylglycerol--glycerol-3-phosphate 3-phosphatidyltransferase